MTRLCFYFDQGERERLPLHSYYLKKKITMSDTGAKSSQPLVVKQEDVMPKRGRGRPRKQTQEPTGAPIPKRPRGRPRGSKNKVSSSKSGRKSGTGAEGTKPRGRPKKLKTEITGAKRPRDRPRKREKAEQEEEEHVSQESSEEQ